MENQINEQELFAELDKNEIKEELIKDNKFPFPYLDKNYRVVMPNQQQIADARRHKNKIMVQLRCNGIPSQTKWIQILKEQGDDIEKLDKEIYDYENVLIPLHISKAKTKDSEVKTRAKFDKEIKEVEDKRYVLIMERANHLAPCADIQARDEYMRFLTSQCTEICIDEEKDEWKKVWASFADYQKEQNAIAYIAEGQLTSLMLV